MEEDLKPFDFIVVTTKNFPDVPPTVDEIISPAVTPGHTTVILIQNGINIEKPLLARFPENTILSGVSMISATEISRGKILHDDHDVLKIGPYQSPQVPKDKSEAAAKTFIDIYSACGKVNCVYDEDVSWSRWRKLVYNGTFNSVATILQLDTTRMRVYEHIIDDLVRPAMGEVIATAAAAGVKLPEGTDDFFITGDPPESYFRPSMCQDIMKVSDPYARGRTKLRTSKGNYIEMETIVGEPVREAEKLGVPTPILCTIYGILKGLQAKTKEKNGLLEPTVKSGMRYFPEFPNQTDEPSC